MTRVEKLLQSAIAILNSSLENRTHEEDNFAMISSRTLISMLQWKAMLNDE